MNIGKHQPKYVWKYTTRHNWLPFEKFNQQLKIDESEQLSEITNAARELRKGTHDESKEHESQTKITTFTKGKSQPKETLLKHDVLLEKRKKMIDNYEDKIGEKPQPIADLETD